MEREFENFPFVVRTELRDLAPFKESAAEAVLADYARWTPVEGQYSFPVQSSDPFFGRLYDRFIFECLCYFGQFTAHPSNSRQCWAYVQNNEDASPVWHDHVRTSTVNGVYYLRVPEGAGQIWFRYLERTWEATPREGHLYLFPRWLMHRPMPQDTSDARISINVELTSNEHLISQVDQIRW